MSIKEVLETEFSEEFTQGMRDRMVVSYYKYGPIIDAYPNKVNAIESLKLRLDKYAETGNTEYLMDVGNFAMIEFILPKHKKAFYKNKEYNKKNIISGSVWKGIRDIRRKNK